MFSVKSIKKPQKLSPSDLLRKHSSLPGRLFVSNANAPQSSSQRCAGAGIFRTQTLMDFERLFAYGK